RSLHEKLRVDLHSMTLANTVWLLSPQEFTLNANEIHVWRASLNLPASQLDSLHNELALDEQERANRYFRDQDRHHFIAARGLLRHLLSRYLDLEPRQIRFRHNPYGKPELADAGAQSGVNFNLSHADGCVVYAFTRNCQIGIDIEAKRPEIVTPD